MSRKWPPVWEGSYPEFIQHGKSQKHHPTTAIPLIPLQDLSEVSRTPSCTSNPIVIQECKNTFEHRWSYLWHLVCLSKVLLMASTVGWQFIRVVLHICASKAKRAADMIHFILGGRGQQTGRRVNSLRRGSRRTGLVTFFSLFFILHEEESSIQMQHGFTLNISGGSHVWILQLSYSNADQSSNLLGFSFFSFFKWHFKIPEKNVFFSFYTAFPP